MHQPAGNVAVTHLDNHGVLAPQGSHTDCEGADGDWYVAYTQPKREQVAVVNLEQQGFSA